MLVNKYNTKDILCSPTFKVKHPIVVCAELKLLHLQEYAHVFAENTPLLHEYIDRVFEKCWNTFFVSNRWDVCFTFFVFITL